MVPQTITGIIFAHLPKVWRGKDTCLRASYWQNVATTLETDTAAYAWGGATGRISCPLATKREAATATVTRRLQSTRSKEYLKRSPSNGSCIILSCRKSRCSNDQKKFGDSRTVLHCLKISAWLKKCTIVPEALHRRPGSRWYLKRSRPDAIYRWPLSVLERRQM